MWFSVVCFWCQSFGDVFTLCMFIVLLVRFELLSGHLCGNSCPLGWPFLLIVFCLFVIFCYFPILVLRAGFAFWLFQFLFFAFSLLLLAHLSRRLTRWAYSIPVDAASVRPSVRASVCSHFQTWISLRPEGQSQSNFIWSIIGVRDKTASGFGPGQVGTLVSLATDSSHRVIMGKILLAL